MILTGTITNPNGSYNRIEAERPCEYDFYWRFKACRQPRPRVDCRPLASHYAQPDRRVPVITKGRGHACW